MNKESNLQLYGSFTLEEVEHQKDQAKKIGSSKMFGKIPEGNTVVRFLPPRPGKETFKVVPEHSWNSPVDNSFTSFPCARLVAKSRCPMCNRAQQMAQSGNQIDVKKAEKMLPDRIVYANVIDRSREENGPLIFKFRKQIHDKLIALRAPILGGDYTHPGEGCDLILMRTGTQLNTRYDVARAPHSSPLSEDAKQMTHWLKSMHNLDQFYYAPTEADVIAILKGEKKFLDYAAYAPKGPTASDVVYEAEIVDPDEDI